MSGLFGLTHQLIAVLLVVCRLLLQGVLGVQELLLQVTDLEREGPRHAACPLILRPSEGPQHLPERPSSACRPWRTHPCALAASAAQRWCRSAWTPEHTSYKLLPRLTGTGQLRRMYVHYVRALVRLMPVVMGAELVLHVQVLIRAKRAPRWRLPLNRNTAPAAHPDHQGEQLICPACDAGYSRGQQP